MDGRCPGYHHVLSHGKRQAVFKHFLSTVEGKMMEEPFAFGTPELIEPAEPTGKPSPSSKKSKPDQASSSDAGQISVEVTWCR